jgi:glucosamine--fructose-6-phosphate aminotransferase (isomerizing)
MLAAKRVVIVACGTSWHAGLIGKQLIETYCRIPCEVEYASEFRYRNPVVGKGDVVIAISQSGETADTLAAVQLAKERGAFIYGVCNAIGSSIPRATDTGTYIHVGPEIGVASTKAFTGQVTVLTMIALAMGEAKGTISRDEYLRVVKGLGEIPDKIREVLKTNDKVADLARTFTYAHNFLYLGRGYSYPVALEGALKLKEISYIHAEAYAAGELKHGTISLIEEGTLVVGVLTQNCVFEKTVSNMVEVKSRGAYLMGLTSFGNYSIEDNADFTVYVPKINNYFAASLAVIPLQLLSYYVAVTKGLDVDKPRNLAKSVTVE